MSFDDFMWLFELERESTSKKPKFSPQDLMDGSETTPHGRYTESSPISPQKLPYGGGEVVLRKNARRMTMPARLQRHAKDFSMLSPIQQDSPTRRRPPSNDVTGDSVMAVHATSVIIAWLFQI